MTFDHHELHKGMLDGFSRAGQFYSIDPAKQGPGITDALTQVLDSWPSDANDRFVRLFAELATIAVTARSEYQEPQLSENDLRAFLAVSIAFFNSFTHR